jgi:hypothetical protein
MIKFKAIDTTEEIVSEPFTLSNIHSSGLCNTKSLYVDCEEHIIIQYTGKHDDYDKDIYEGDILNNEVRVYYSDDWSAFCVKKLDGKYFYNYLHQYMVNVDEVKITGNIHIK